MTGLLVNEVDSHVVESFEKYLNTLPNRRDGERLNTLSPNTIVKHLKILKAILNEAVRQDLLEKNPMMAMKLKEKTTVTRHLENTELRKLESAPFEPGTGMNNARNLYLFAIYTAGMRIGDVLMLRWNNIISTDEDMRLNYIMSKNKKSVNLRLMPEAQAILAQYMTPDSGPKDYIFPYLDSSADYARYKTFNDIVIMPKELHKKLFNTINSKEVVVNKQLKQVADMIGVEPFTFHSARRDFGRLAYDAGVKTLQIQDLLCHESLYTTEVYVRKLDTSATDNALEQTFSKASKDRRALSLVRELRSLGYGKTDVKRLFDEAKKPRAIQKV